MATQSWIRGKLIGAGTFGSVNLAMNREDGEVFAVKSVQVTERDAGSIVALRAIENEIEFLQKLDSRYVVRCLGSDWTEEDGKLMRNVFLEYMPEGSLTDFLKQFGGAGARDEHLLRTYTRSIVEGINYLHSNGIVHCDIKGKNVLVGNGNVKLTDFGSAKRVGEAIEKESDSLNCSAPVNGTPLWMAPEVVRQVEQGPPSDIWSLGCTVLEMATGRAPWSNLPNTFVALYHIGCTDELPAVPDSLSAEAHDFLAHCFQRDPCNRWTSAQLLQHPFLTTRFVAPNARKTSPSSISVLQFPADSDSDMSESFDNSVPTLLAPSLFKRGLVSEQPSNTSSPRCQEQVEGNLCSSPSNPGSGQWIVVRSPKSCSTPPSFALSDWMAPESLTLSSSTDTTLVGQEGNDSVVDCEQLVELSINTSTSSAPCSCSRYALLNGTGPLKYSSLLEVGSRSSDFDTQHIHLESSVALGREEVAFDHDSVSKHETIEPLENESPATSYFLVLFDLVKTRHGYSEHECNYQHLTKPQILHWRRSSIVVARHSGRIESTRTQLWKSNRFRDVSNWNFDQSDQCISYVLDEYAISIHLNQRPRMFGFCVRVCMSGFSTVSCLLYTLSLRRFFLDLLIKESGQPSSW